MELCIRVDDIGWGVEETNRPPLKSKDRGFRIARRFHEAMEGLPYLGAVIPMCADHKAREWLASSPTGLTVATHGFNHWPTGTVMSEFHNFGVETCRQRLAEGNKIIGQHEHFVPPFNATTPELYEALRLEGFKYVWGTPTAWPTPPQPYWVSGLRFIPSWTPLYGATRWRMGSGRTPLVDTVGSVLDLPGLAVLTLHVTWEAVKSPELAGVTELVGLIREHVISPREYLQCVE